MDLPTLLSLITTLSIVAAGIFAGVQLRQINKQRTRESALQMLHAAQTPEFMEGVNIVFNLPENLTKEQIEEFAGDKMICLLVLFGTFESLGILVHRHEIKLELIDDFFSGPVILFWKKLRNYFLEIRQSSSRDNYGEWVQWLAERLEEREKKTGLLPAHIQYKTWKEK